MMMTMITFSQITLQGKDAAKFLQGQLTVNVAKLTATPLACAICNLKGRVQFGLWASKIDDETFALIISDDCLTALQAHLKKYGAFSKFSTSEPIPVYPCVVDGVASFSGVACGDFNTWAAVSITQGNYWITADTSELFQPQELRLHQRGGVDYDKGCYIGQEIIARLYFKASPKAYLHRVLLPLGTAANAGEKVDKVQIVNSVTTTDGIDALVIGTPDDVAQVGQVLALPDTLSVSPARS